MIEAEAWLVALDALSGLLLGAVAWRFAAIAHRTRRALPLLFAAGLALLAMSYPTVARSHFDLEGRPAWDALRIAGQTGGALVVLCAYLTARVFGRARPGLALGWALVALTLVLAILTYVVPPSGTLTATPGSLAVAHATTALAWMGAAALAGGRLAVDPRPQHALVPAAFAAMALGTVAWLAVDLGSEESLLVVVYVARFLGIGLLLAAVAPRVSAPRIAHAPT